MIKRTLALLLVGSTLALSSAAVAAEGETITVYKSPWCGCCEVWTEAAQKAGFHVVVNDVEDLTPIKEQAGIPDEMQACHTAVIGESRKYVIEGHVPLEAIDKMMSEQPDIRGIVVPGMPEGSVGMGYDPEARYTVYSLGNNASDTPEPYMEMGN
ncbi:DUF411 domain-containing protein [Breoghania sp.]|uniref:DUF411 domain-containing protein n=1 Tax=Breoghania sp. TaxID=2065378 RepID=UPI002AA84319|nr:DUF411 domain-containing protein [Breoghania sp.]